MAIESFFLIFLGIHLLYSIEKLATGFHEKFPLFKMKFNTFLLIEIIWLAFWVAIFLAKQFVYRNQLMAFFNVLVLGFGVWHLAWWGITKKYVPGLIASFLFVITFLFFYFKVLF